MWHPVVKFLIMKIKAIGLVSGGLDSIIATCLMLEQGIEVIPVMFVSPFFHSEYMKEKEIDFMGLKAKIIRVGDDYLSLVKNPEFGYGAGMNPCIDCKIYMVKKGAEIMAKEKASFIFTGEVLDQRPFSQRQKFFDIIEKKSGMEGKILRPLSALLLKPTIPEIEKIVNREKLLAISGRSRKQQLLIAQEKGIKTYLPPAGGCLLTDRIYAGKIKELFEKRQQCDLDDTELIKHGRVFWYNSILIVIGRNECENKIILNLTKKNDVSLVIKNVPSPLCIIRGNEINNEVIEYAKEKVLTYTKQEKLKKVPSPLWEIKKH